MMQENSNQGGVPNNLPIGQPPQPQSSLPNEPEDILQSIDSAAAEIKQPDIAFKMPVPPAASSLAPKIPPAIPPVPRAQTKEPILKRSRKVLMLIIILILVFGALGTAAWYAYGIFIKPAVEVPQLANLSTAPDTTQNNQGQSVNNTNEVAQPKDTDRDGLSDEDEQLYGTNIEVVDSDSDGLTDRDEIRVFETDPNVADTDGDSFSDGDEVRNGYDPKGPGKLLEIR